MKIGAEGNLDMTRTMMLYGHCTEVQPPEEEAMITINWTEAVNFHDIASHLIAGEFENAVIIAVNSTHGVGENAAVRVTVDREATTFKGFSTRFWLHDKPYAKKYHKGKLEPLDFDWVAYIPCASFLT
ncbi:MAG: hypothetical protein H0W86_01700 [Armatimonadetes bacterium]|nr:hypothetical protein [Armatimonadota bacterium]